MDPSSPATFQFPEKKSFGGKLKSIPKKYWIAGVILIAVFASSVLTLIILSDKNSLRVPTFIPNESGSESLRNEEELDQGEVSVSGALPSTPTPTLDPDATASWSAFQSLRYGYSFSYPPGWTAVRTAQTDPLILDYVVLNPVNQASGSAITFSYSTRTVDQALAIYAQQGTPIVVNNLPATQKTIQDSDGNVSIQVIIPDGSNTVVWFAESAYQNILNGILSTFEFL